MICPDCEGRGYNYSDPDHKMMECTTCDGAGELEEEEYYGKTRPVQGLEK